MHVSTRTQTELVQQDFREIMRRKGLKHSDVAKVMGCARSAVSLHLSRKNMTVRTLERLARAMDVELEISVVE